MTLKTLSIAAAILTGVVTTFASASSFAAIQSCNEVFSGWRQRLSPEQEALKLHYETQGIPFFHTEWTEKFPIEFRSILKDKTESAQKFAILKKLGFSFELRNETWEDIIAVPTFPEFVQNYIRLLDIAKVPESKRILPALALYRENPKVEGGRDFALITPGIDPWPDAPGFKILNPNFLFNLPDGFVQASVRRGRFPLMATHDVFHFVSHIMDPSYMMSLRAGSERIKDAPDAKNMNYRMGYVFELLSAANPEMKKQIYETLRTTTLTGETKKLTFESFKSAMNSLSEEELISHAARLAENYGKFLRDYGGGVARSQEKSRAWQFIINKLDFGLFFDRKRDNSRERNLFESPAHFSHVLGLLLEAYQKSDVELAADLEENYTWMSSERYDELRESGLPRQDALVQMARKSRPQIRQTLRDYLAKMEYFLWRTSRDMTPYRIISGIATRDGSFDPEVADFLRDGIGANSNIYQILRPYEEP